MINFECPSCQASCLVQDQYKGHKLRCPKCGTRVQHMLDGTIALLSVGNRAPSDIIPPHLKKYVEVGPDDKPRRARTSKNAETVEALSVDDELPGVETSNADPA